MRLTGGCWQFGGGVGDLGFVSQTEIGSRQLQMVRSSQLSPAISGAIRAVLEVLGELVDGGAARDRMTDQNMSAISVAPRPSA